MKITAEHLAGLRELQASLPPGGLRPVEIPRWVLDVLVEHTFALAKLQDAVKELAVWVDRIGATVGEAMGPTPRRTQAG